MTKNENLFKSLIETQFLRNQSANTNLQFTFQKVFRCSQLKTVVRKSQIVETQKR